MKRGDIYLVSLDPVLGREQQGTRPVIVVSPDHFHISGMALVVPVTSGGSYARDKGFTVSLSGAGMQTTGVALCNQCRVLDMKSRRCRWLEAVPVDIVEEILNKLLVLFE